MSEDLRRPTKFSYIPLIAVGAMVLVSAFLFVMTQINTTNPGARMPSKYIFAPGFTGKVRIDYNVAGAPELDIEEGMRVIPVPASGLYETSSEILYGTAKDEFYRRHPDGSLERLNVQWIKMRKAGVSGDDREYFETSRELELRDERYREQGLVDAEGNNIIGNPYELMIVRDDFDEI